jgi:hypothetical protein
LLRATGEEHLENFVSAVCDIFMGGYKLRVPFVIDKTDTEILTNQISLYKSRTKLLTRYF